MKFLAKMIGFWLNTASLFSKRYTGKKGMYIFCKPIRVKINDEQKKYLEDAILHTITVHKEQVPIYKWGNGAKKILLVHGWASYAYRWRYFINRLQQEDVTVYAIDSIGHGLSTGNQVNVLTNADTIIAAIEKIGGVDILFGHSFGGFSSIFAFEKKPDLAVKQCILMATAENADSFFAFYQEALGLTDKTKQLIIDAFIRELKHPPSYYKAANFANKLQLPCLIVHDKYDNETPYQGALDIHRNWQGSQLITTENIGHQMKDATLSNFIIARIVAEKLYVLDEPKEVAFVKGAGA